MKIFKTPLQLKYSAGHVSKFSYIVEKVPTILNYQLVNSEPIYKIRLKILNLAWYLDKVWEIVPCHVLSSADGAYKFSFKI